MYGGDFPFEVKGKDWFFYQENDSSDVCAFNESRLVFCF